MDISYILSIAMKNIADILNPGGPDERGICALYKNCFGTCHDFIYREQDSISPSGEDEKASLSGQNLLTDSKLRTIIDIPEALSGASSFNAEVSYDFSYSA